MARKRGPVPQPAAPVAPAFQSGALVIASLSRSTGPITPMLRTTFPVERPAQIGRIRRAIRHNRGLWWAGALSLPE